MSRVGVPCVGSHAVSRGVSCVCLVCGLGPRRFKSSPWSPRVRDTAASGTRRESTQSLVPTAGRTVATAAAVVAELTAAVVAAVVAAVAAALAAALAEAVAVVAAGAMVVSPPASPL